MAELDSNPVMSPPAGESVPFPVAAAEVAPQPAAERQPGMISRMLGPTAGPQSGNARAIMAYALAAAYVGLLMYLTVEWVHYNRTDAKDLVLAGWGALGSAFTLIVGLYFGRRSAEGA